MATVSLLGFPQDLAHQLSEALIADAHTVERKKDLLDLRKGSPPGVIFVNGDEPGYLDAVRSLKRTAPSLPVVVATRQPEASEWLNALDAGAADYCGAPFEPVQVRWIMNSISGETARSA